MYIITIIIIIVLVVFFRVFWTFRDINLLKLYFCFNEIENQCKYLPHVIKLQVDI